MWGCMIRGQELDKAAACDLYAKSQARFELYRSEALRYFPNDRFVDEESYLFLLRKTYWL